MANKPTAASPKGFDFGTPAHFFGTLDTGWVQDLTEAQVVGCAYGWEPVSELGTPIPSLSLVARNEASIRSAFSTLYEWTKGSDDDAVDITIIFLNSGAYLLGISPEVERRSAKRPIPAMLDRLEMVAAWIKTMDTTHPSLIDLRSYHRSLIAPIAVGVAIFPSTGALPAQPPSNLSHPVGLRSLIKFNVSFAHEDDKQLSPAADMIIRTHRNRDAQEKNGDASSGPELPPAHWRTKRKLVLEEIFPLTLFRARTSGLLDAAKQRLSAHNVASWQIEQAVCNLVMGTRMGAKGKHYSGISASKLLSQVIDASATAYEIADNKSDIAPFTVDDVIKQVRLDATYLVDQLGEIPRDGSLRSRQSILKRRGHLEP
jgi:hypothetical protein